MVSSVLAGDTAHHVNVPRWRKVPTSGSAARFVKHATCLPQSVFGTVAQDDVADFKAAQHVRTFWAFVCCTTSPEEMILGAEAEEEMNSSSAHSNFASAVLVRDLGVQRKVVKLEAVASNSATSAVKNSIASAQPWSLTTSPCVVSGADEGQSNLCVLGKSESAKQRKVNIGSDCAIARGRLDQAVAWSPVLGGRRCLKAADVEKVCRRARKLRGIADMLHGDGPLLTMGELAEILGLKSTDCEGLAPLFHLLAADGPQHAQMCDLRLLLVGMACFTRARPVDQMRFAALMLNEVHGVLTHDELVLIIYARWLAASTPPPPNAREEARHRASTLLKRYAPATSTMAATISHKEFLEAVSTHWEDFMPACSSTAPPFSPQTADMRCDFEDVQPSSGHWNSSKVSEQQRLRESIQDVSGPSLVQSPREPPERLQTAAAICPHTLPTCKLAPLPTLPQPPTQVVEASKGSHHCRVLEKAPSSRPGQTCRDPVIPRLDLSKVPRTIDLEPEPMPVVPRTINLKPAPMPVDNSVGDSSNDSSNSSSCSSSFRSSNFRII